MLVSNFLSFFPYEDSIIYPSEFCSMMILRDLPTTRPKPFISQKYEQEYFDILRKLPENFEFRFAVFEGPRHTGCGISAPDISGHFRYLERLKYAFDYEPREYFILDKAVPFLRDEVIEAYVLKERAISWVAQAISWKSFEDFLDQVQCDGLVKQVTQRLAGRAQEQEDRYRIRRPVPRVEIEAITAEALAALRCTYCRVPLSETPDAQLCERADVDGDYVHADCGIEMSARFAVRELGITYSNLTRFVKEHEGLPPKQLYRDLQAGKVILGEHNVLAKYDKDSGEVELLEPRTLIGRVLDWFLRRK